MDHNQLPQTDQQAITQSLPADQVPKLEVEENVANDMEEQFIAARKAAAQKDMLYGALWCVGGIIATVADVGLVFWGAILFGGIQFFRGVVNS